MPAEDARFGIQYLMFFGRCFQKNCFPAVSQLLSSLCWYDPNKHCQNIGFLYVQNTYTVWLSRSFPNKLINNLCLRFVFRKPRWRMPINQLNFRVARVSLYSTYQFGGLRDVVSYTLNVKTVLGPSFSTNVSVRYFYHYDIHYYIWQTSCPVYDNYHLFTET